MTAPRRGPPGVASGARVRSGDDPSPINGLGQTEVQHLDDAVRRDLDVRRLQVAVDDPFFVGGFERLSDLPRDDQRLT